MGWMRWCWVAGLCVGLPAHAAVLFQDGFTGPASADLIGRTPDAGGAAWVGAGYLNVGEFRLVAPDGVQDVGPNPRDTNAGVSSTLSSAFVLSALAPGEVLHLGVTMANIAATPAANPLESSRVDLVTGGSSLIALGELHAAGKWGVGTDAGSAFASGISTAQPGDVRLDLYLDPADAFQDGPGTNAILRVNGGCPIAGFVPGLSGATQVDAVRLVRNVDDEVRFRGLLLETAPVVSASVELFRDDLSGAAGAAIIGTLPDAGGLAWVGGGAQPFGEFLFGPVPGSGVRDAGPNARNSNAFVRSELTQHYPLASLPLGSVLHLHVSMENLAADPAANVFEATRADLVLEGGGLIGLGELATGGFWGAAAGNGAGFRSQVSSTAAGAVDLDLYVDPNDELQDGAWLNAAMRVNGGCLVLGHLPSATCATVIAELRLVRNLDDEVAFKDLLLETSAPPASATTTLFQDDLDGPLANGIEGTVPESGGLGWVPSGSQAGGQFRFGPVGPGGVVDEGPNSRDTHSVVGSTLASPFALSNLGPSEVLHLRITMQNIAPDPAANLLESSRVDLMTSTSGLVALGELRTDGNWGASSESGPSAASAVGTGSAAAADLDLYLDPRDAFQDGATHNARVQVNGGTAIPFEIPLLSPSTVVNEVRLVRNLDDEVRFDDVRLERLCVPLSAMLDAPEAPPVSVSARLAVEPNPFYSATRIRLALPATGDVHVAMYDLAGRCVRTLQDGRLAAGEHVLAWDGADTQGHRVAAGVYFARLRSQGRVITVQAVRLR